VQHRAQRGEKTLEKNVGKLDIFRLVESESQDIFTERMNKFGLKYPNAMEYLKQIPPYRWVHFAQVQSKAATFGWRSNNIGEIGQGNVLCTFRKCHPIDFMSQLMQKVNLNPIRQTNNQRGRQTCRVASAGSPEPYSADGTAWPNIF
jgi:hypothetical protein